MDPNLFCMQTTASLYPAVHSPDDYTLLQHDVNALAAWSSTRQLKVNTKCNVISYAMLMSYLIATPHSSHSSQVKQLCNGDQVVCSLQAGVPSEITGSKLG